MKIEFVNSRVEEIFLDLKKMSKKHGAVLTKAIHKRYAQLVALSNVKELMLSGLDNPHILKGDFHRYVGWSITGNIRMILDIGLQEGEQYGEGVAQRTTITIMGVCDYHGNKDEWIIN